MMLLSVNVVTYHPFVIDKQIIVAVSAIPVFFAEASHHVAILLRLTPQRAVIATESKAV